MCPQLCTVVRTNQDVLHLVVKPVPPPPSTTASLETAAFYSSGLYFPAYITRMWWGSSIRKCFGIFKADTHSIQHPSVHLSTLCGDPLSPLLASSPYTLMNVVPKEPSKSHYPSLQINKWSLKRLRGFSKVTQLPGRHQTDHVLWQALE